MRVYPTIRAEAGAPTLVLLTAGAEPVHIPMSEARLILLIGDAVRVLSEIAQARGPSIETDLDVPPQRLDLLRG